MSNCVGAPAELCALSYAEGTLPEAEAEQFEEHYFDCPACLEYLQTIQAMSAVLARRAADEAVHAPPQRAIGWPVPFWALGAAAAILVVGAITYKMELKRPAALPVAHSAPAPSIPAAQPAPVAQPANEPAVEVKPAELADLVLPAFAAPNLRGDSEDAHFLDGMKAYGRGNCASALSSLAQVPSASRDSLAAEFYSGACQAHNGNLAAASATLRAVAGAGDSPQQEAAYYYLAQVALKGNDAAAAHKMLLRTIALRGDLERKAGVEDRKVLALVDRDRETATRIPKVR
jgi:hypothetical protein